MTHSAPPAESEPISIELTELAFDTTETAIELAPPEHLERAERRGRSRQVMRVQARICVEGDQPLDAHTVDLSAHGLAVTSSRPLNVDQECNVELGISAQGLAQPPALRASVRYCARLRDGEFRIGMKFTAVSIEAAELLVAALEL